MTNVKGKIVWAGERWCFYFEIMGVRPWLVSCCFSTFSWATLEKFFNFMDPLCLCWSEYCQRLPYGTWWQMWVIVLCIGYLSLCNKLAPKCNCLKQHLLSHMAPQSEESWWDSAGWVWPRASPMLRSAGQSCGLWRHPWDWGLVSQLTHVAGGRRLCSSLEETNHMASPKGCDQRHQHRET